VVLEQFAVFTEPRDLVESLRDRLQHQERKDVRSSVAGVINQPRPKEQCERGAPREGKNDLSLSKLSLADTAGTLCETYVAVPQDLPCHACAMKRIEQGCCSFISL